MPVPGDLGEVLAAVACGAFVTVAEPVIRITLLVISRPAPAVPRRGLAPATPGLRIRAKRGLPSGAA